MTNIALQLFGTTCRYMTSEENANSSHCSMDLAEGSGMGQVPEFRVSYDIKTDGLDALYKRLKPKGVTMTGLLAKAVGIALASHPTLYACAPYPYRHKRSPDQTCLR